MSFKHVSLVLVTLLVIATVAAASAAPAGSSKASSGPGTFFDTLKNGSNSVTLIVNFFVINWNHNINIGNQTIHFNFNR